MKLISALVAVALSSLASAASLDGSLVHQARLSRFTHESVPGYTLDELDPSSLGLDKVPQKAGYLGTPSGDQLFFWLFESRRSPSSDPLLIWLNGGPGCSSMESVLFENGPSSISDDGQISRNNWSWNGEANVLYIDNPAGAGYSTGGEVDDSIAAGDDFKNALRLFYLRNQEFTSRPLHISGESYAGRYIPVFAEAINTWPQSPVKVSSILIGNGLVNPAAEYQAYQPMLCGQGGFPSVLSQGYCEQLAQETPSCVSAMTRCMDTGEGCRSAASRCGRIQGALQSLNPYDIRDSGCAQTATGLCYPGLDAVQSYFNRGDVKQALGVNPSLTYDVCNNNLNSEFYSSGDPYQPTFRNVTNLLQSGVPVLVYNGDADIILNWLGARTWTHELQWSGQQGFQAAAVTDWAPKNGEKRGEITNYEKFSFLRVHNAGHMVPHDQPESAYYMVNSWLSGDYGFTKKFQ